MYMYTIKRSLKEGKYKNVILYLTEFYGCYYFINLFIHIIIFSMNDDVSPKGGCGSGDTCCAELPCRHFVTADNATGCL